jgi:hypothetical protein
VLFRSLLSRASNQTTLNGLNATANSVSAYQSQTSGASAKDMVLAKTGSIIGLILSFIGVIFLLLTIYAGILWMTASGNSAQVTKAKDILINAAIGLILVFAAYSITAFIGNNLSNGNNTATISTSNVTAP